MIKPLFISILPNLKDYSGHDFTYNESLGNSLKILNWNHVTAIPKENNLSQLSENWIPCLPAIDSNKKRVLKKLLYFFSFTKAINRFLNSQLFKKNGDKIVFLESFSAQHLISILFSILFRNKSNLQIWLLYRFEPYRYTFNGKFYYLINKLLKSLLRKDSFKLLTDSEKLKPELEKVFKERVHAVPIPHTNFLSSSGETENTMDGPVLCWWPGPPRINKGLEKIKELVSHSHLNGRQITFRLAESSNVQTKPNGINVILIKDSLSKEEYNQTLASSHFIILPYDPYYYQSSTSGIFVESIFAGKIPIVSENTWMAYELKKFQLNELIFDWNSSNFINLINHLSYNKEIQEKINVMRDSYKQIHNESSFAKALGDIYNQ